MLKGIALFLLLATSGSFAESAMQERLDDVLHRFKQPVHVAVEVRSLNNNQTLYARDIQDYFTPASNLKILTAAGALLGLGSQYRYQTSLATDGNIVNQQLQGNLVATFTGDPVLTLADLDTLVAQLNARGVQVIRGNVLIDGSHFTGDRYAKGWMWDDLPLCFSAGGDAVMVDHNCVSYQLSAGPVGAPPQIHWSTNPHFINLVNNVVTQRVNPQACDLRMTEDNNNRYVMEGCFPANERGPRYFSVALMNPTLYMQAVMNYLLAKNNIVLKGAVIVRDSSSPRRLTPLVTHYSPPLQSLVIRMLKNSDNQIANSLLLTLGRERFHRNATWKLGAKALREVLREKTGIDIKGAHIADGDGGSRYNLIQPAQVATVLAYFYHHYGKNSAFYQGLPVAGKDGTLRYRLYNTSGFLNVHAKTGTMSGVTSLSGYLTSRRYGPLLFVIMMNNIVGRPQQYTALEDRLCLAMINA